MEFGILIKLIMEYFQLPSIDYYTAEKNIWYCPYTVIGWFDFRTLSTEGIKFDKDGYVFENKKEH